MADDTNWNGILGSALREIGSGFQYAAGAYSPMVLNDMIQRDTATKLQGASLDQQRKEYLGQLIQIGMQNGTVDQQQGVAALQKLFPEFPVGGVGSNAIDRVIANAYRGGIATGSKPVSTAGIRTGALSQPGVENLMYGGFHEEPEKYRDPSGSLTADQLTFQQKQFKETPEATAKNEIVGKLGTEVKEHRGFETVEPARYLTMADLVNMAEKEVGRPLTPYETKQLEIRGQKLLSYSEARQKADADRQAQYINFLAAQERLEAGRFKDNIPVPGAPGMVEQWWKPSTEEEYKKGKAQGMEDARAPGWLVVSRGQKQSLMAPGETELSKAHAKDLHAAEATYRQTNNRIARLEDLERMNEEGVIGGPGSAPMTTLASILAGVGLADKDFEARIARTNTYNKEIGEEVINRIQSGIFKVRVTNVDLQFLRSITPDIALSKESRQMIIRMMKHYILEDAKEYRRMAKYYKEHNGDLSEYEPGEPQSFVESEGARSKGIIKRELWKK